VRKLVLDADITPHWIGKSSRCWYREPKLGTEGKTFLLADEITFFYFFLMLFLVPDT